MNLSKNNSGLLDFRLSTIGLSYKSEAKPESTLQRLRFCLEAKTLKTSPGLSHTTPLCWRYRYRCGLDHEAVLLAVVGHKDDIAVGGPDEAGELQVVLGARGRRLHGRNLVGLNAAELRGRVQHPNAAQQTGVHLRRTRKT